MNVNATVHFGSGTMLSKKLGTENWNTVSAWLQAQGSIFQNGFLGGVQFKISLKKWTFERKSRVPQKHDFSHYLGLYSRVGLYYSGYGKWEFVFVGCCWFSNFFLPHQIMHFEGFRISQVGRALKISLAHL